MTCDDLFSESDRVAASYLDLPLPDADVRLYMSIFSRRESDEMMERLLDEIHWQQERITIYGQTHDLPRLTAWYGDPGKRYTYSGITVEPMPWTDTLLTIWRRISQLANIQFNSVLLNRYRSGSDGVAWHSDDEPELGRNPVIGSVTFGEARPFQMKHKAIEGLRESIQLEHGSFLLMSGTTQHRWLHRIPKSRKQLGERINLTFRVVQ